MPICLTGMSNGTFPSAFPKKPQKGIWVIAAFWLHDEEQAFSLQRMQK